MTWNVCAGTNPYCSFYRRSVQDLAWNIGRYALTGPIKPDVIFLQEFCTGAAGALELWLEKQTGRMWTVQSWGLTSNDGTPYACHPDHQGGSRGVQSVTVAVADHAATFQTYPLTSPPWYVKRSALCATISAKRVKVCGTHLSAGLPNDDRQPGAPYRKQQIRELMAAAAQPGYRAVFGGDLNVAPPDSDYGSAAGRRAIVPAYKAYDECDQRGGRRTGRWTHTSTREDGSVTKKLDYLFAPKGSVRQCHVEQRTSTSDHMPLYVKVAL
ncbi:endonuclease/exonuclease/phosphatase family protein [Nonomuraea sp. NPDC005983]|uniref:endonuclease/exonuclease/phosphatase family protein n=1 Tax=Nonomuraea sp. NPDC005983 TaxID=3155595 RepID=UPI0033AEA435